MFVNDINLTNYSFNAREKKVHASIKKTGNIQLPRKINTTPVLYQNFKGYIPSSKYSDLKNYDEFEMVKSNFYESISYMPTDIQTQVLTWELTPKNIDVADLLVRNKNIYNNPRIMNTAGDVLFSVRTGYQVQLAKRIFSDEKLSQNKTIIKNAPYIIRCAYTKKQAELINKVFSNDYLCNRYPLLMKAINLIDFADNPEQENIVDKILSDEKLYTNEDLLKNAKDIVTSAETKKQFELVQRILTEENLYNNREFLNIADNLILYSKNESNNTFINKLLSSKEFLENETIKNRINNDFLDIYQLAKINDINPDKFNSSIKEVEIQKKKILEHPELYVNGDIDSVNGENIIENFFYNWYFSLLQVNSTFDKETLNTLLRKRLNNSIYYLEILPLYNTEYSKLLSDLASSNNTYGKPFMPAQKLEFIDLISAYKSSKLSKDKIKDMIKEDRVDVVELNIDLFNEILKKCNFNEEEIKNISLNNFFNWDMKHIYLLSKQINKSKDYIFKDIIREGILGNFDDYIHDKTNIYGKSNAMTKNKFEMNGLNYDVWLHPSETNNVKFYDKDKNYEQLKDCVSKIKLDIEILRDTGAKDFIDKQLSKYMKNGEFIIPEECETSKAKLTDFTQNILKQLEPVFKRAEYNLKTNPDKKSTAQRTLNIKENLNQQLEEIIQIPDKKISNTLDLTIKMWDRNPSKDMFQGNYSTCCIGMGDTFGESMPHYIMNTAYNMIELVDNTSGNVVGNALCYFIKDNSEKPAFVVDNIEINNAVKLSYETGKNLRTAIAEYADNVSKEVTGSGDTSIYMSAQYNDVPISDLEQGNQNVKFIGSIDNARIYMDLFGGLVNTYEFSGIHYLCKLK